MILVGNSPIGLVSYPIFLYIKMSKILSMWDLTNHVWRQLNARSDSIDWSCLMCGHEVHVFQNYDVVIIFVMTNQVSASGKTLEHCHF